MVQNEISSLPAIEQMIKPGHIIWLGLHTWGSPNDGDNIVFTQSVNGFGGAYDFYQESLVVQNVYGAITRDYSVDGTQF